MHTGNNPDLFFSKESQYLASSSGDLLDDWAILVTALLLMNRPHACEQTDRPRLQSDPRVIFSLVWRTEVLILTLSSAATKPASLLKADMTKALYFLWTSRVVWTYTLGSWKRRTHLLDQRVLVNRHVKVNQRELLAVRTLSAASPHFSMAARPWLWMWVSRSFFSSPRPSVIRDTRLYIRPRSTKRSRVTTVFKNKQKV